MQFSTLIKSSSATVLAASLDRLGPHGSVQVSTLIKSSSAAVLVDDDSIRVETCTDSCGPNRSDEAIGDLNQEYGEVNWMLHNVSFCSFL